MSRNGANRGGALAPATATAPTSNVPPAELKPWPCPRHESFVTGCAYCESKVCDQEPHADVPGELLSLDLDPKVRRERLATAVLAGLASRVEMDNAALDARSVNAHLAEMAIRIAVRWADELIAELDR